MQKWAKLVEVAGMEGQAEEEPEGEEIVGPGEEALKFLTTGIPFFSFKAICLWTLSF